MARVQPPVDWQVNMCTDPYDPANIPWSFWRMVTNNLTRREEGQHFITFLNSGSCRGVYAFLGQPQDDGGLWKIVPTRESVGGHPIFHLYNKLAGGPISSVGVSSGAPPFTRGYAQILNAGGDLLQFDTDQIKGVIFDSITNDQPQLYFQRSGSDVAYNFSWVTRYNEVRTPNVFHKNVSCQMKYLVGWQLNLVGSGVYNDPNDHPIVSFLPLLGRLNPNSFVPNPVFEEVPSLPSCLDANCNSNLNEPWPQPCLNYVRDNPSNTNLSLLLTPRCTQGTAGLDRVINDRVCSYWCQAGLPSASGPGNQQIHDLCFSTRRTSCNRFYDPASLTGWVAGTSPEIMSRCACYMPNEFYAKQFANVGATPPTGTPNCFYQPCYSSPLNGDYFTSQACTGVGICLQSGGTIQNNICGGEVIPPPLTPDPGEPVTDPTPTPVPAPIPASSLSWIWWVIGAIFIIAIIVTLVVVYNRNRQRQQQTLTPELLYLLSRSSTLLPPSI